MAETVMDAKTKNKLLALLHKLYPDARSELDFKNDFQMLVCVMLSAQCTDKKVNETTPSLFKAFPSFMSLSQAAQSTVEQIIRPVNYYKTKAKNIVAMAQRMVSEYKCKLPTSLEELTSLPGVGRKTANVVLCETGAAPALPVDTHVFRVSKRLGIASGPTPEKVETELMAQFDPKHWRFLHHALILHGRRVCKAPRPLCPQCQLAQICPSRELFSPPSSS